MGLMEHDQRLLALIDWYREMGVDEAVAMAPVDWLDSDCRVPGAGILARLAASSSGGLSSSVSPGEERGRRGSVASKASGAQVPSQPAGGDASRGGSGAGRASAPVRSFQTQAPDESLLAAREAVNSVESLSVLRERLMAFDGCGLKATATNTCFFRGAERARVMIVGEAPGRDEDREGRPFVGRAGQLLDKMLGAIDLGEADVHITNVVYWRPPGNRTPTEREALMCRPFLEQQVRLVAPDFLVLLGGAAAKNLLNTSQGIMRLRGKWQDLEIGGANRKVLATLHPAYLLRTPAAKRLAWRDLLAVKSALGA